MHIKPSILILLAVVGLTLAYCGGFNRDESQLAVKTCADYGPPAAWPVDSLGVRTCQHPEELPDMRAGGIQRPEFFWPGVALVLFALGAFGYAWYAERQRKAAVVKSYPTSEGEPPRRSQR